MSRKSPLHESGVDEYRSDLMRATLAIEASAKAMEASCKSPANAKNGNFVLYFGSLILGAGMFFGGMQVKTAAASQDHEDGIRLKVEIETANRKLPASRRSYRPRSRDSELFGLKAANP
jgi:hypothetical protein